MLIAGRVLQGLAGGLINPQVSGLVQQLFPRGRAGPGLRHDRLRGRHRHRGRAGASAARSSRSAGRTSAGGCASWSTCPSGSSRWCCAGRLLPPAPRAGPAGRWTCPARRCSTAGVFGLLFPAVQFDASHDPRLALLVLPALAVLAGFVGWERGPAARRGYPLVDLGLFRIRSFADGIVLAVLFFCAYTGTPLVLALFLQDGLGFTPAAVRADRVGVRGRHRLSAPVGGRLLPRLGAAGAGRRRWRCSAAGVAAAGLVGGAGGGRVCAGGRWRCCWLRSCCWSPALGGGSGDHPEPGTVAGRRRRRAAGRPRGACCRPRSGSATRSGRRRSARSSTPRPAPPARDREVTYGRAYGLALGVSVVFALAATGLATRALRHDRSL